MRLWPGLGMVVLLVGACGPRSSPASTAYPSINGIPCETSERITFHIHAHLAIYANGQPRIVPYGIGIGQPWQIQASSEGPFVAGGSCFYWLHTHTQDGVIHIEAPQPRSFSLGDFFAIWGQPLPTGQVVAYLNGERYTGDPAEMPLEAHALIQLDVDDTTPPQPFTFPPGL